MRAWLPGTVTTRAPRPVGRHAERVRGALHHERRHGRRRRARAARVFSGRPGGCTGKARHSTPTAPVVGRRAARHPRARRAAADDERQVAQRARAQVLDDRDPGRVELARRSRRAPAGDAIGLLDQRDADAGRARRLRGRHEVARRHAAAGAVAEHERAGRLVGGVQVGPRGTVRRVDVERPIAVTLRGERVRVRPRAAGRPARSRDARSTVEFGPDHRRRPRGPSLPPRRARRRVRAARATSRAEMFCVPGSHAPLVDADDEIGHGRPSEDARLWTGTGMEARGGARRYVSSRRRGAARVGQQHLQHAR